MPPWLPSLLRRIRALSGRGQVRFTLKAIRELAALGKGMDVRDACDVLVGLTAVDFAGRLEFESTGERMYVFKPSIAGTVVYVKLILRVECLVVSFHEDEGEPDEESS